MMFFLFFVFFYLILFSSYHILTLLLLSEFLVLVLIVSAFVYSYSLFSCLMITLIGVCMAAYGVSLLVNNMNKKGSSYMDSIFS